MSDVTRYTAVGDGVVKTDPAGPLVKWEDYARLKAEVERLWASSFVTAVPVEEYEKLKAELTNCKSEADRLKAEVNRSTTQYNSIIDLQLAVIEGKQAEIDRLNSELFTCSCTNANMNKHMNENARLKAEVERLKMEESKLLTLCETYEAEVERLRKAGDAVSLCLEAFWKGKPYDTSTNIECFDTWRAAKKNKPNA